jgi:DNA-binding protein
VPSLRTKNYIHSVSVEFPHFIKQVQIEGTGIAIVKATPENVMALKEYETALKNIKVRRIPVTGILKHKMLKAQNSF